MQLEAYRIGESDPAPYFKLVCQPDENMKAIGNEIKDHSLSDREKLNVEFWESMMLRCKGKLDHFCNKKAPKYHYHSGSSGKTGIQFVFLATGKYYGIELYIDAGEENENLYILKQLERSRTAIEKELNHDLDWQEIHGKRACRIKLVIAEKSFIECDREEVQSELINFMIKFESVFRPKIKQLKSYNEAA